MTNYDGIRWYIVSFQKKILAAPDLYGKTIDDVEKLVHAKLITELEFEAIKDPDYIPSPW